MRFHCGSIFCAKYSHCWNTRLPHYDSEDRHEKMIVTIVLIAKESIKDTACGAGQNMIQDLLLLPHSDIYTMSPFHISTKSKAGPASAVV
jgi:hypothetical protein